MAQPRRLQPSGGGFKSPFGDVRQTWSLENQSPAARREQMSVFNTPSRYAAESMHHSRSATWNMNSPYPRPSTPLAQSATGASRMEVDTPEDARNQQPGQGGDDGGRMEMPETESRRQARRGSKSAFSIFGFSPSRQARQTQSQSPCRQLITIADDSDRAEPDDEAGPRKAGGNWFRRRFGSDRHTRTRALTRTPQLVQPDASWADEREWSSRTRPGRRRHRSTIPDSDYSDSSDGSDRSSRPETTVDKTRKASRADGPRSTKKNKQSSTVLASFFSYIDRHPNLPHILGWYAQLVVNCVIVGFGTYSLYSIWASFVEDIDKSSREEMADRLAEIAVCSKHYRDNLCDPATRVPAMESICNGWDRCMGRNPSAVSRAQVAARAIGMVFNSFLDVMSVRSFVFIVVIILAFTKVPGMVLSRVFPPTALRAPTEPQPAIGPPATPRHGRTDPHMDGGAGYGHPAFAAGYHAPMSSKRAKSPVRPISLVSDDEQSDDSIRRTGGGSSRDGSPGPLVRINYNSQLRRRRQASARQASTEAVVGREEPFSVRRSSGKR